MASGNDIEPDGPIRRWAGTMYGCLSLRTEIIMDFAICLLPPWNFVIDYGDSILHELYHGGSGVGIVQDVDRLYTAIAVMSPIVTLSAYAMTAKRAYRYLRMHLNTS